MAGNQLTNNRSFELQIWGIFKKDNIHFQLINQAKEWSDVDIFLGLISDVPQCEKSYILPCSILVLVTFQALSSKQFIANYTLFITNYLVMA